MARYDDLINQLLNDYVIGEGNRNRRNKKDSMNLGKGAEEQKFDKDIAQDQEDEDNEDEDNEDLKENIAGIGLGGMMNMSGNTNPAPGWNYVDQDDEDMTDEVSDRDLVKNVKKKHTASQKLLTKAAREIKKNKGSLSASTRKALARDEYAAWSGHGREEDAEETANQKTYGGNKGDHPRRFNRRTGRKSEVKDY